MNPQRQKRCDAVKFMFSVVLFLCFSQSLAFRGLISTCGKLHCNKLLTIQKPRALESQSIYVSETERPGCRPTTTIDATKSKKSTSMMWKATGAHKSVRSDLKSATSEPPSIRQYSEAETKATITAMKKMQAFERQGLNPELEIGHGDDELGFVSPTFRSGFVSILGNANVGKSTLMNHLLGQDLSIVSPKPQTTRHRIFGILTKMPDNTSDAELAHRERILGEEPPSDKEKPSKVLHLYQFHKEGFQMIFADTPGMLAPAYKLQEVMQNTVRSCVCSS